MAAGYVTDVMRTLTPQRVIVAATPDHDVVLTVPSTGVVWAGDLLENGAVPFFGDSYPLDWPSTRPSPGRHRAKRPLPGRTPVRERRAMTERTAAPTDLSVAQLRVERAFPGGDDRLCNALADPTWLGPSVDGPTDRPDLRRVETDLAFDLTGERRTVTFRKAAYVDIGSARRTANGCAAEISWRASSSAPLFPVFAGTLTARDGRLVLDGVYAPPGGGVGLLVDRGFLHVFAKRTAGWFLDRLIAELESSRPWWEPDAPA